MAFCDTITPNTNLTKVWNMAKGKRGSRNNIPALIDPTSGETIFSNVDRASLLMTTFYHTEPEPDTELPASPAIDSPPHPLNLPFSLAELSSALARKRNTAPGPDHVCYATLQNLPPPGHKALLDIINHSFTSGTIPIDWQTSNVVAIPKPGKDPHSPTSYRPIALSSCLLKTLEKMISNRLEHHLHTSNHHSPFQFGFTRGRSTTEPVLLLVNRIKQALKEKKYAVLLLMDITKAFDLLPHSSILKKLTEIGINGNLYNWISSFLRSRKYSLSINGEKVTTKPTAGVGQGSVLAPRLFSLVMDGFAVLHPPVSSLLFADDNTAIATSRFLSNAIDDMQSYIDAAEQYADTWGLNISSTKTVFMIFTPNGRTAHVPRLYLSNQQITRVTQHKVLGLTINQRLTWTSHIKTAKTKATKALSLMRVVASKEWGADRKSLTLLYSTLIRSRLDYCSMAFASAPATIINQLETIQNGALRTITGLPKGTANSALQAETNIWPLKMRRIFLTLKTYAKAKAHNSLLWSQSQGTRTHLFSSRAAPSITVAITTASDLGISQELDAVAPEKTFPPFPPWNPPRNLHYVYDWLESSRDQTPSPSLKLKALSILQDHPANITIFTDGSLAENHAAIGVHSVDLKANEAWSVPASMSILNIELTAIMRALQLASTTCPHSSLRIITDSKNALALLANYKMGSAGPFDILKQAESFPSTTFIWVPSHVGVAGNEAADRLANTRDAPLLPVHLPLTDFCRLAKTKLLQTWQRSWDTEATGRVLHQVKPNIGPWRHPPIHPRVLDTVTTHLRCGRAKLLAHRHRIHRADSSLCPTCMVSETLEHFLLTCSRYDCQRANLHAALQALGLPLNTKNALGNGTQVDSTNLKCIHATFQFVQATIGHKYLLGLSDQRSS